MTARPSLQRDRLVRVWTRRDAQVVNTFARLSGADRKAIGVLIMALARAGRLRRRNLKAGAR